MRRRLAAPTGPRWLAALALLAGAGCPTVDLGEPNADPGVCRPDRAYFADVVWPEVLAPAAPARSCVAAAGCHATADGRSALRLDRAAADDPAAMERNYLSATLFLNCGVPEASELVTKPLAGPVAHGGGDLFAGPDDPAVQALLGWFEP